MAHDRVVGHQPQALVQRGDDLLRGWTLDGRSIVGRLGSGGYAVGPGQFTTPCERMHRPKLAMPVHSCCTSAWVGPPPLLPSRCAHPWLAVEYLGLLPASWTRVALGNPVLVGSGNVATPSERMQLA
jgi:hypothetical protein